MYRVGEPRPDIAAVARLLGDHTRATILGALVGGQALPATELAATAGVTRPTISEHLSQLVDRGLLKVERCGRHSYYRIAGSEVADLLESLAVVAPVRRPSSLRSSRRYAALSEARTCYDHLAGRLGVMMTDSLLDNGLIKKGPDGFSVDTDLWESRPPLGVRIEQLSHRRRPMIKVCIDWSERRNHIAGSLAAALTARLFELDWIERPKQGERPVVLTESGGQKFSQTFGRDGLATQDDAGGEAGG